MSQRIERIEPNGQETVMIERHDGQWCVVMGEHWIKTPWVEHTSAAIVAVWLKSLGFKKVQVKL